MKEKGNRADWVGLRAWARGEVVRVGYWDRHWTAET